MAKAPEKEKKAEAEGEEQPPPKKKSKLPLVIALAVVLVGGGGGAAWFFLFKGKGAEAAHEVKAEPLKPPVFVPIDNFTVNLTPEGSEQYLQVAATLKVLDVHAADTVKQYMPEMRHRILLLLSAKKASEINTAEGRERLSEELRVTTNNILLVAAGKAPKPMPGPQTVPPPAKAAEEKIAAAEDKPAQEEKPAGEEAAKPEEGQAKPQAEQAAPAPAASAKAAADDPVQSVFFTSFIIQ